MYVPYLTALHCCKSASQMSLDEVKLVLSLMQPSLEPVVMLQGTIAISPKLLPILKQESVNRVHHQHNEERNMQSNAIMETAAYQSRLPALCTTSKRPCCMAMHQQYVNSLKSHKECGSKAAATS